MADCGGFLAPFFVLVNQTKFKKKDCLNNLLSRHSEMDNHDIFKIYRSHVMVLKSKYKCGLTK